MPAFAFSRKKWTLRWGISSGIRIEAGFNVPRNFTRSIPSNLVLAVFFIFHHPSRYTCISAPSHGRIVCLCVCLFTHSLRITHVHAHVYLQALLAEYQHEEVNEVCGNHVKEEDEEVVNKLVTSNVTVRIPNSSLERVVVSDLLTLLHNLTPRDRQYPALSEIVNGHLLRSGI